MSIHDIMNFETKRAIKNALLIQIEEVGFERITVKNLAITANINRGTFYLHYKDKYEVMEDLQQELLNELESYVKKRSTTRCLSNDKNRSTLSAIYSSVSIY